MAKRLIENYTIFAFIDNFLFGRLKNLFGATTFEFQIERLVIPRSRQGDGDVFYHDDFELLGES